MGGLAESCLADFNFNWGDTFERNECFEAIADFLKRSNNTISPTCMQQLFVDGVNTSPNNPLPTFEGCKALCGVDWGYYPDAATRVVDWIVPIVFLLSNINLSPVERRTMMGIIHALGDPIDTLWSLLDKLYAWWICNQIARQAVEDAGAHRGSVGSGTRSKDSERGPSTVEIRTIPPDQPDNPEGHHSMATRNAEPPTTPKERIRIIATVLGGFEELTGHALDNPAKFYTTTIKRLGNVASSEPNPHAIAKWKETALSLVDDRTNEFLRTGIAVALYLFQVFSEFIDQISQNSESTPGGRIGAAMILSWLIPVALLSNLLGGFPSRRSNLKPLLALIRETMHAHHHLHAMPVGERLAMLTAGGALSTQDLENYSSWGAYFDAQRSTGAIYGFRPFKTRAVCHARGTDLVIRLLLPVVATLPVIASFVFSFMLHWEAVPAGFSCRHVWVTTVFGLWCFSPFITWGCTWFLSNNRVSWWVIFVKDAIIGFGTIAVIIASVIGVFNSCFCWSLVMSVGESAAVMIVNTRGQYLYYKKTMYPILVGVCVFLQLGFIAVCVPLLWKGLRVMRWGEKPKRKQWVELRGGEELQVLHAFLSFSSKEV